jgi:CoA:oxalate CoA-transferase
MASGSELAGVKVADFSAVMAGPYCTRLMADLGADVVKVEPPGGEHTRSVMPHRDGESSYYGMLNAGKRSICLDLRSEPGRQAARGLIHWADVVVENFRPGVMARFGLDYDTVAANQPALVYCSISGYGQEGPWTGRPATAQVIHAASGYDLGFLAYQPNQDRPASAGMFVADGLSGALAFGAILAALRASTQTGQGRYVDLSLLDGMLSMMVSEVQSAQFPDDYHRKSYPPLETKDGYVMIAAVNQRNFEGMAKAIGHPELVQDERFRTNADRWRHAAALHDLLEAWTRQHEADECEREMLDAGVPAARYRTVAEQFEGEQLVARGTFVTAEDGAGPFQVVGTPFQYRRPDGARQPRSGRRPLLVSACGSDTRAVLEEVLGADEAARLLSAGVAGETPA